MTHMGSDHRCAMGTFVIDTPQKDDFRKTNTDNLETTKQIIRKQTDEKTGKEKSELEKRYQHIIEKIKEKAEAANKELKQSREKTAETTEAEMAKENAKKMR